MCCFPRKRVGPTGKAYGLDMTDEMLALARENQRKAGVRERRVPEGRDRKHSAARQLGRCDHLQLRDQPFGRQGPRAARGFPRAEAGRPICRVRCRGPRRRARRGPAQHGIVGRLHRRRAARLRLRRTSSPSRALTRSTSSRRASTASKTPGSSLPAKASTWTRSRRMVEGKFMSAFIRAVKPAPRRAAVPTAVAKAPSAK